MKRFCEYLRYVQSKGVGIILRVPFVSIEQVEAEELTRHIALAYEAYAMYGVYPMAIEAPKTWLQCENGLEALRGFLTVPLARRWRIMYTSPASRRSQRIGEA